MCSGDGKKCRMRSRGVTPDPSVSSMTTVQRPIPITDMGSTPIKTMDINRMDDMRSGTVAIVPISVSVSERAIIVVMVVWCLIGRMEYLL